MILILLLLMSDPLFHRPDDPADLKDQLLQEEAGQTFEEKVWLERVTLHVRIGELDQIGDLLNELCRIAPNQPVFLEARMIGLGMTGNNAEAVELGERILERFPNYPTIRVNLAKLHMRLGRKETAVNLLLTELGEEDGSLHRWASVMALFNDHRPTNLYQILEQKNQTYPQSIGLQRLTLSLLVRDGRFDRAALWLAAHPQLSDDPELKTFVAALDDFKEPP